VTNLKLDVGWRLGCHAFPNVVDPTRWPQVRISKKGKIFMLFPKLLLTGALIKRGDFVRGSELFEIALAFLFENFSLYRGCKRASATGSGLRLCKFRFYKPLNLPQVVATRRTVAGRRLCLSISFAFIT
jgi:hypothetical protein